MLLLLVSMLMRTCYAVLQRLVRADLTVRVGELLSTDMPQRDLRALLQRLFFFCSERKLELINGAIQ